MKKNIIWSFVILIFFCIIFFAKKANCGGASVNKSPSFYSAFEVLEDSKPIEAKVTDKKINDSINTTEVKTEIVQTDSINIKLFGAKGDGISDDWPIIQKAIDKIANNGGGVVYFPAGNYIIKDKTVLIWGKNVKLIGQNPSNTTFTKKGSAGWWGENLSVCGKSKGGKYYGAFGNRSYNSFVIYQGRQIPAQNIQIEKITFTTKNSDISKLANNVSVFNSDNVHFRNCNFINAPQSNVAVINNTLKSKNGLVEFENCKFSNSGAHNFRAISYNQGDIIGNRVVLDNCKFLGVKGHDVLTKEIKGKAVNIWYRSIADSRGRTSLSVVNCIIDNSGEIYGNANIDGLNIKGCDISSRVTLNSNSALGKNANVVIEGNRFLMSGSTQLKSTGASFLNVSNINNLHLKNNQFPNKNGINNVQNANLKNVTNLMIN